MTTQPAQDADPNEVAFDIDPQALIASLTSQRNAALDEAARWRAVALQERAVTTMLAGKVAEHEAAAEAPRKGGQARKR